MKKPGLIREKHALIATMASKLFIEKGYNQTTIRDISIMTGMAIGNLYNYVFKKEEILNIVFTRHHERLENILYNKKVFAKEDPKESLRNFVTNFMSNIKDFTDEMKMIYCESRFLSKENQAKAKRKEIEAIYELEQIISEGVRQGVFNAKDTYFAASMIIYQLSILAMKGWLFDSRYSAEDLNDLLEDYILKAVIC